MRDARGPVGVLGGTLDPIHLGHLAVATEAADALGLDEVLIVPASTPPHRDVDPAASVFHRFAMVALAAQSDARLVASDLELARPGRSYTADTLRALQAAGRERWQIFFLIGADAFAEIATWREYPAVLDLAQFVVCSRGGAGTTSLPARLPGLAPRMFPLVRRGAGGTGPRHVIAAPKRPESRVNTRIFLLDCPTPDVSSTSIRARARAGQPLAGLVPPEVDDYIRRHGLYRAAPGAAPAGRPVAGHLHE